MKIALGFPASGEESSVNYNEDETANPPKGGDAKLRV